MSTNAAITIVQLTPHELQTMMSAAIVEALRLHTKDSGELWKVKDLAQHYDVSERTILNWEREGRIAKRSGTHWKRTDVLKFDADRMPNSRPI